MKVLAISETTIRQFVEAKVVTGNACPQQQQAPSQEEVPIRVVLPTRTKKQPTQYADN